MYILQGGFRYIGTDCRSLISCVKAAGRCRKGVIMMTQYQMFFMYNYASSDYYRTLEILSGMMQILRTKLEQDQVAELIHDLAINSSDGAYSKEFEHFLCDVQDYYGTGYENLKSAFEKMEEANYVWPYKV